jgi:hypothetical protein
MAVPATSDADPEQLKNLLLVLEHARADAWLRRDPRALDALLADEYAEITMLGRHTKEEVRTRLFPEIVLHTFTIEDPAICLPGEGAAVLSYLCYQEFTIQNKKRSGNYYASSLYTRHGKQWKIALWQITPVKKP